MSYQQLYTYVVTHSYETVLILGLIAMVMILYIHNTKLSSVAFFDPLTKWGNRRFLNEVFLPQLLLEANIEVESDDKDEAIHFMQIKLDRIESIKKIEQRILARLLTANIKKYLLHPSDQCFRIDNGVFLVIITRKKINKEKSDQFLQNIRTAADDLILIYPQLHNIISTDMLSWAEVSDGALDETLKSLASSVLEEDETNRAEGVSIWAGGILSNLLHKKLSPQLSHT